MNHVSLTHRVYTCILSENLYFCDRKCVIMNHDVGQIPTIRHSWVERESWVDVMLKCNMFAGWMPTIPTRVSWYLFKERPSIWVSHGDMFPSPALYNCRSPCINISPAIELSALRQDRILNIYLVSDGQLWISISRREIGYSSKKFMISLLIMSTHQPL